MCASNQYLKSVLYIMVCYKAPLVVLLHLLASGPNLLAVSMITCGTTFGTDNTDVVCPKENCSDSNTVYGTHFYTSDSTVCRSAWHDGRIIPWSDNNADRTVRWTTCTSPSVYLQSLHYGAGKSWGYGRAYNCKKFVSSRKTESLYRLDTLSSLGSAIVRVYGGSNVDLTTDIITASVYDPTTSTPSPPTEVLPSNTVGYKEYRIHTGVNVFTTAGNKANLYSRVLNINYGKVPLLRANQSSTLRLISSTLNLTADAGKAIDGNPSTDFMNEQSCSHTLRRSNTQNPWWRVELNGTYSVHGIKVTSRDGSHDCKNTVVGRNYMGTVSEARNGSPCKMWKGTEKPFQPENYCRNPDSEPKGPWCYPESGGWRYCDVSLCSGLSESLSDFQVRISNTSDTPPAPSTDALCKHYTGTIGDATTLYIACDRPVTGRYLYIIKNGNSKSQTLSLCEVELWGKPAIAASSTLTTRVSVGDGVTLTFEGIEPSGVRWQKDGIGFYASGDIVGWNDKLSNTIDPVEAGHGGVYTIYKSPGNILGITRLVVRVCPSDKYGIDCTEDCPKCENGGICHHITGECICPPGFTGHNCSTGCGGNRFGSDCLSKCSEVESDDGCRGKYVCTIDPYGCSCVTGFKGMTCSEECQDGYYGADCQQKCGHCNTSVICNPYTGLCRDACAPGYMTFPYCQTEIARLKDPPAVVLRTRTTLSVRWTAWQSGIDHGVGPVEKYIIEYEQDGGGVWNSTEVDNVANQATFTYNISNTDVSHVYLVRIKIKVAGGLLGNSSPEVEACGEPQAPEPSLSNTDVNTIDINWPEPNWRCGTRGWYVVEYNNRTDTTWARTSNITLNSTSLYTAACITWQVRVRTFNKHMSSVSGEKNITSQNKAPSQVKDLGIETDSVTNTSLTVAWKEPESNGCPIEEYRFIYKLIEVLNCTDGHSGIEESVTINTTTKNITGLKPNSKYEIKVAAKTKTIGEERIVYGNTLEYAPSGKVSVISFAEATRSVSITVSELNCQDRNGVITHYEYMITNDRTTCFTASINTNGTFTELQTDITGLVPSNSFIARVRANTAVGAGPWSDDVSFTTREEVLAPVSSLDITQVNSTLKVKWTAPPDDGCQLQSYEWRYQLMSQGQCDGSQAPPMNWTSIDDEITSVVIPNVSAYSTYNISVRPKGPSKYGHVKNLSTTTSQQAPSAAPQNVSVTASARSVNISWLPPDCYLRNGLITKYDVRITTVSTECSPTFLAMTNETSNASILISGLYPHTNYSVRLRSYTIGGPGPWTKTFRFRSAEEPLGGVQTIGSEELNGELYINWTSPASDDGCQLRQYVWRYKLLSRSQCPGTKGNASEWQYVNKTHSTFKVSPFSTYVISVAPIGPTLRGQVKSVNVTTRQEAPDAAPDLKITNTTTRTSIVSWTVPYCRFRNGIITHFVYNITSHKELNCPRLVKDVSVVVNTNESLTQATVSLEPWTNYTVAITACTQAGCGPWKSSQFATSEEVLGAVRDLRVEQTGKELHVNWSHPHDDGCQIQGYEWEYRVLRQGNCTNSSVDVVEWIFQEKSNLSGIVPAVLSYSLYEMTVRPIGPTLRGKDHSLQYTTSQTAPSAPPQNANVVDTRNTSLSFSWSEVECVKRNGEISSYRYQIRNDNGLCVVAKDFVNETVSRNVTFMKLTPYTTFEFRVKAMVDKLAGPWTAWTSVTTNQSVPPAPSDLKVVDHNPNAFKLSWKAPCPPRGKILKYFVSYEITNQSRNGNREMLEKSTDCGNKTLENCTETTLYGLRPDTTYFFRVKALTVGWGEWSNTIEEITTELVPGEPASLTCSPHIEKTSISFKWSEPLVTNGKITKYLVELLSPQKSLVSHKFNADLPDLAAGKSYKIFVYAFTSVGKGPSTSITCWTALPDVPKIQIPKIRDDDMTDHSVKVNLVPPSDYPNFRDIKFYLIVVERMSLLPMRRRRSVKLDSGSLKGYSDSAQKYITANITSLDGELSFVIGDGQESNGYRNQELNTGKQYRFIYGFVTENEGDKKEYYQYIPFEGVAEEEAYTVKNWKKERENTTIGSVVGTVAAVILVIAIAGFVFYRRRRANKNPSTEELRMDDISTIENTSSSTSNNYQEAAQGPAVRPKEKPVAPPKPIKPTPPAEPVYSNFKKPISVDELDSYVAKRLSDDDLADEYKSLPSGLIFPRSAALKDDNKTKNRFTNILPYNKNRVILEKIPSEPNSDYINASYIDGYKKPRAFIAAMGPNRHTVKDFWRMVWQENINRIVMLTNPVEGGKRKCEVYWPDSHEVERYGDINVTLTGKETKPDYVARTFEVLKVTTPKQNQARELVHYHFTSWADHDVPKSSALWKFYRMVKERMSSDGDKHPTVVHCSAGVGRTGTFIMMDILSEQIKAENILDILGQVYLLRQQRVNMVQTWTQYEFIHSAMVENIYGGDTFIPSKDYEKTLSELFTEEQTKGVNTLQKEFQTLRRLCPPCDPEEYGAGRLPQNTNKNRFAKILPLGRARPYLMTPGEEGGTDYINAVFVNGFQHRDAFIVTQMPLPNTVFDFWRMIYDHDSSTIVMLNASADGDKTCARYWAEEGSVKYGHFRIETAAKRFEHNELIIHRTFNIVDTKKTSSAPRQIKHFELTNWPKNQKIPPSATQPALIELYDLVQNRQRKTESKPVTVHCLDGCMRSGFFCSMANLFDKIKVEQGVDVFQTVKSARSNRPEFVPDIEQYKSLYLMAQRFLESFETYANFQ